MNICRSKEGHVKLYYKINDSDIGNDMSAYFVFVKMLFLAHYEDNFASIRFRGKQYKLKAGEFSATMNELSEYLNLPLGTLRHVVKRLENDKRVDKRSDNKTTVYSICNWSKYQGDKSQKLTNKRTNGRTNEWTNATEGQKNIKNINKGVDLSSYKTLEQLGRTSREIVYE